MATAKSRGFLARIFIALFKIVIALVLFSVLWVLAYKVIPVPVTATMQSSTTSPSMPRVIAVRG